VPSPKSADDTGLD